MTETQFKIGDIIYFKEEFISHYTMENYIHQKNQPYIVVDWNASFYIETGSIKNLGDKSHHFAHTEMIRNLISEREWKQINRDQKINQLLNDN
jgi:hypothetical protein